MMKRKALARELYSTARAFPEFVGGAIDALYGNDFRPGREMCGGFVAYNGVALVEYERGWNFVLSNHANLVQKP